MQLTTFKAMIVDDDPFILRTFKTFFTKYMSLDFEVLTFKNPANALEVYKEFVPDVLLVDYMMPVMTGLDFLKKINGKVKTVIVLFSAYDTIEGLIEKAEDIKVDVFLQKPIRFQDLEKILIEELSKKGE